MEEGVYEGILAAAQSAFDSRERSRTGYYSAETAAKKALIEKLGSPGTSAHTTATVTEELSAYELRRQQNMQSNNDALWNVYMKDNIPSDAVLLWIQKEHLDKIIDGEKTMEIRSCACVTHLGKKVHLAESGSNLVRASVVIATSEGPFTQSQWEAHMDEHCCGETRYYTGTGGQKSNKNYGWGLVDLMVFAPPRGPIYRPPQARRWQLGPFIDKEV